MNENTMLFNLLADLHKKSPFKIENKQTKGFIYYKMGHFKVVWWVSNRAENCLMGAKKWLMEDTFPSDICLMEAKFVSRRLKKQKYQSYVINWSLANTFWNLYEKYEICENIKMISLTPSPLSYSSHTLRLTPSPLSVHLKIFERPLTYICVHMCSILW